jgi:hypothetical protein
MAIVVIANCPKCGDKRILTPQYGEIIAVYCLCQPQEHKDARYPTRMEILPVEDRERVAV